MALRHLVAVLAAAAIAVVAASGPIPSESSATREAEAHLPDIGHVRYETAHFVVYSDADVAWTRDQGGRLERTWSEFHRAMRRLGITPEPLRHKLVCVLFSSRESYREFARRADGVHAEWIGGYYSPSADRTVFYHADSNPSVVQARARLAELELDLESLEREATKAARRGARDRARELDDHGDRWRAHLARERARVDHFAAEIGVATTVHEAIHQLLFHTRVQSPYVMHPLWLSEGLATSFETDDPTGAFGPDYPYEAREDGFRELLDEGRLIPLEELLTWQALPNDDTQTVHAFYHQSYAFTTWLFRARRAELRTLLETYNAQPAEELDGARCLEIFESVLGPASRVEKQFLRDVERDRGRLARVGS